MFHKKLQREENRKNKKNKKWQKLITKANKQFKLREGDMFHKKETNLRKIEKNHAYNKQLIKYKCGKMVISHCCQCNVAITTLKTWNGFLSRTQYYENEK